jgi:hypothetical protein
MAVLDISTWAVGSFSGDISTLISLDAFAFGAWLTIEYAKTS